MMIPCTLPFMCCSPMFSLQLLGCFCVYKHMFNLHIKPCLFLVVIIKLATHRYSLATVDLNFHVSNDRMSRLNVKTITQQSWCIQYPSSRGPKHILLRRNGRPMLQIDAYIFMWFSNYQFLITNDRCFHQGVALFDGRPFCNKPNMDLHLLLNVVPFQLFISH
jgi:hypothetical protein